MNEEKEWVNNLDEFIDDDRNDYESSDFDDFKMESSISGKQQLSSEEIEKELEQEMNEQLLKKREEMSEDDLFADMRKPNWRSQGEKEQSRAESLEQDKNKEKMRRVRSFRKNSRENFNSVADRYKINHE